MATKIRCSQCRYTRQDINASQYEVKHCGKCENRDSCEKRKTDIICEKQALKWKAIECGNPVSEYYRGLLNVTSGGDKQTRVTWGGCPLGERRNG